MKGNSWKSFLVLFLLCFFCLGIYENLPAQTPVESVAVLPVPPALLKPGHKFDLDQQTIHFIPRESGRYEVQTSAVNWVSGGDPLAIANTAGSITSAAIDLPFMFPFGGRTWNRVFVNSSGSLTFESAEGRWDFVFSSSTPANANKFPQSGRAVIASFWNPFLVSKCSVVTDPAKVVVTWESQDGTIFNPPTNQQTRFQAVLLPSGEIRLSYKGIYILSSVVGVFPGRISITPTKLTSATFPPNPSHPGDKDIVSAQITQIDDLRLEIEATLREPIPEENRDNYSLIVYLSNELGENIDYFERVPWGFFTEIKWSGGAWQAIDWSRYGGREPAEISLAGNKLLLRFKMNSVNRPAEFRWGLRFNNEDIKTSGKAVLPPEIGVQKVDFSASPGLLKSPAAVFEFFHAPILPDDTNYFPKLYLTYYSDLSDGMLPLTSFAYDHIDYVPYAAYGDLVSGLGRNPGEHIGGQLQVIMIPAYLNSPRLDPPYGVDSSSLELLMHEFSHGWLAFMKIMVDGKTKCLADCSGVPYLIEPPLDRSCGPHWYAYLNAPAAGIAGAISPMGGANFTDNGDGTFTYVGQGWGFSYLDLYALGLIPAGEVKDTFYLENAEPTIDKNGWMAVKGDKKTVSIQQILAAQGTRNPPYDPNRTTISAAIVLLVPPGETADTADLDRANAIRAGLVQGFPAWAASKGTLSTAVLPSARNCVSGANIREGYVSKAGGVITIDVLAPDGCPWIFEDSSPWLGAPHESANYGDGNGRIFLIADPNPDTVSRTGQIKVGGINFDIVQLGSNNSNNMVYLPLIIRQ